jgi:hypothetical protein
VKYSQVEVGGDFKRRGDKVGSGEVRLRYMWLIISFQTNALARMLPVAPESRVRHVHQQICLKKEVEMHTEFIYSECLGEFVTLRPFSLLTNITIFTINGSSQ